MISKFEIKYQISKLKERLIMRIAWLLPKNVAYMAYIRIHSKVTTCDKCGGSKMHPDEVTWGKALKCWTKC